MIDMPISMSTQATQIEIFNDITTGESIIYRFAVELTESYWDEVLSLIAIGLSTFALIIIVVENYRLRRVGLYQYLFNAETYFSNSKSLQRMYKAISNNSKGVSDNYLSTNAGIEEISAYLTFLESFYPLIENSLSESKWLTSSYLDKEVMEVLIEDKSSPKDMIREWFLSKFIAEYPAVKYSDIDARFGYRFFHAISNETIQKKEIFPDWKYYPNLIKLYAGWVTYREEHDKEIPYKEEDDLTKKYKKWVQFQEYNFKIRSCNRSNLEEIVEVQKIVVDKIDDKNIFIDTDVETIKEYLCDERLYAVRGVFSGNSLCAYLFLIFTPDHAESLSKYIYNDKYNINIKDIVTLDTAAVLPDYRGNGLQRLLIQDAHNLAKEKNCNFLVTCVSPSNHFSLNNILKEEFCICRTIFLHDKKRILLYKKI